MLDVLGSVTAPGREGRPNEDGCGTVGPFAFVIDGATGLGHEPLLDGPSDAQWLTSALIASFHAHGDRVDSPLELMQWAVRDTELRFTQERRRSPQERYEIPTAAVLVAQFTDGHVDIAELGDCALYLRDGAGISRYGGTARGRALEQENARKMMGRGGGRSPEVVAFLRAIRNKANTPKGYPIIAPEARSADRARVFRHAINGPCEALFLSDGFDAAIEDYGLYDGEGLMDAARSGLSGPLEALRAVERDDPDCVRYPRFKQGDDATALYVRSGAVQPASAMDGRETGKADHDTTTTRSAHAAVGGSHPWDGDGKGR